MEKRLLLAVTFSILVMLVYPFLLAKITPSQEATTFQLPENKEVVEKPIDNIETKPPAEEPLPFNAASRIFANDRYELKMVDIGGSINKIEVKDNRRFDIDLVDNAVYDAGILAIEGKGTLSGLSSQQFEIKEDTGSFYTNIEGLGIEKSVRFLKDKYALHASIKITNHSGSTQNLSFEITTGSKISSKELYESRTIGADVLYNDGRLKRIASGNFKKDNKLYQSNVVWLALRNKYYSIIAKPDFIVQGVFTKNIKGEGVVGFIVDNERILSGETKTYSLLFYIGPTDLNDLKNADASFAKALNFGMFTSISLILLGILKFFYSMFHNYGIAILLLTCCVSLLLYPLTFKSLKSMRRLQELQPQMETIRLQYKDNQQKLNKEIMELYRRYNVNPMSGCLPMLLQMPIFIALYQTLMRSVELKGAGFLWITDLSMPDAAFHLPITMPFLGNTINLLPILMIGAMIIQQKLSQVQAPGAQTDQQKMMGSLMPIVFGFIFYSLPAGLVLYWLTNTILTSSLQYLFLRKT